MRKPPKHPYSHLAITITLRLTLSPPPPGFPLSFGVFQAHYASLPLFSSSTHIPTIGELATAFSNFGFPFISPICLQYPHLQRPLLILGWAGCISSLVLASFATKVWHLMVFQGVMYGVCWPLCYTPFVIMTNGWFMKRRGSVYGIIYGGSGLGGIVLPYMLEKMLEGYGFRLTLRMVVGIMLLFTGPGLVWVKGPPAPATAGRVDNPSKRLGNLSFLKDALFWIFAAAAFIQGLAFYLPRFYLPEYTHALGLSHNQGAAILAFYGAAQIVGQMGLGYLSDKLNIFIPVVLSTAVPGLAALVIWGPAQTFSALALFALLFSSFGAAFSVLWSRMSTYLTDDPGTSTFIFGLFLCERGIANMLAGPIGEALTGDKIDVDKYGLAKYGGVVVFVGLTSILSALSGLGWFVRRKGKDGVRGDDVFEAAAFEPLHELESLSSEDEEEEDRDEDEDEELKV